MPNSFSPLMVCSSPPVNPPVGQPLAFDPAKRGAARRAKAIPANRSDHARSVEAAENVKADLRQAQAALTEGDLAEAKSKLEDAHAALPIVSPDDGKTDLEQQHASLVAQLPATDDLPG